MGKKYWCYRIDTNRNKFFMDELNNGRLRQGWGWDKRQDLRDFQMDAGARRNRRMYDKVRKGDILLVPQLPKWGHVAVVEATEDWSEGYKFDIHPKYGDYGHIFPAKFLFSFTRKNRNVTGNLRSTLRNPSRFWGINHYREDVDKLLTAPPDDLIKEQNYESRLSSTIGDVFTDLFDEQAFTNRLYEKFNEQFTREEWEYALVHGLRKLFPFYRIERTGGPKEKEHGTDILIRLPSLLSEYEYAIAIQVKDYSDVVDGAAIRQINKADSYWDEENLKLIEKLLIITKAPRDRNQRIAENDSEVKIIFAEELKGLLSMIGQTIGLSQIVER